MSRSHDAGHDTAAPAAQGHGHGHGHGHGVSANADRRWLTIALVLIAGFMVAEFVVGLIAGSLALLSDSAHMLTDAASIVLALIAIRLAARPATGGYTYGLRRAEILSAQANGITLLLLAVWFVYEGITRLIDPPPVEGGPVLITALVGIVVNVAATWCISRANRSSLNVEGAFQHILNDLFAFIATAIAGVVLVTTGFTRADAIAALVVAALMIKAGWALVRESGRIFLEAAPRGTDPDALGAELVAVPGVAEVHDLHLWEITSGEAALSAHVMVRLEDDCHEVQKAVEDILRTRHGLRHTTLQVDHAEPGVDDHCEEAHGTAHRAPGVDAPTAPGAPRSCR
ncbi:MAG: cation transporter [Pseudonocardia sp.]|uniref:cation diffusion facilitator family transporter n=1 Tax=unclassified Pseudonocardia TaxID=2619320 RepID=UPI00086D0FC2|nr:MULTISPECIES: cation diffusion facilitator family transporter [unclassified Pseudonocardia]MBN9112333.1 cation transporter [Pseudonocardia sp.]ODU24255.1 MAG: cation diffusion facilitator family transporter [Pseudonocardia sp. SCN 72-51]ODV09002.1 MAG: cation diffusion facilitator family transporter [Pseudonocardia sp. SCN 73-27]